MGISLSGFAPIHSTRNISPCVLLIIRHCTNIIILADIIGEKIKDKIQNGNCIANGWTQTSEPHVCVPHVGVTKMHEGYTWKVGW